MVLVPVVPFVHGRTRKYGTELYAVNLIKRATTTKEEEAVSAVDKTQKEEES
jgi:hypothetical protein